MQCRNTSITLQQEGQTLIRRRTQTIVQHFCGAVGCHARERRPEQLRSVVQGTDGGVTQHPCVGFIGHDEVRADSRVCGFHRCVQRHLAGQHGVVSDFLYHDGDLDGLQRQHMDFLGGDTRQPTAVLFHLLNFLQQFSLAVSDKTIVVLLSVDGFFHDFSPFSDSPPL